MIRAKKTVVPVRELLVLVSTLAWLGCKEPTGGAGPPAKIVVAGGDAQTATVNTAVTTAPAVKVTDARDRVVAGARVTFKITTGAGTITDSTPTTGADGVARLGTWTLGKTAGANSITATFEGQSGNPATITATGTAGPPAQLALVSGGNQSARANTPLTTPITIAVRDQFDNPVSSSGATVEFAVVAGGGGVSAATATATDGVVTAPTWRLGKSHVAQRLRATLGTLPPLDILASVQTLYQIDVRFFGPAMTDDQRALFTNAARRIEGIVVGDVIDANATGGTADVATVCGAVGEAPLNEIIDDVLIYASVRDMDGPGNILASAGPCFFRQVTGTGLMTAVGIMSFDAADLGTLGASGNLQEVITHEMLHVLGVGTLWTDRNLLSGGGTADPRFTGILARDGCLGIGATISCASSVPVENNGGQGTRDGHWRESTFDTELMTGFLDGGKTNPISAITINSLADIGFIINGADSDAYSLTAGALRAGGTPSRKLWAGWEHTVVTPQLMLLENGRVRAIDRH